jgi:hypothetical protein
MSTTLLFVHSPVVGPTTWTPTADVLQQNGFGCVVPDLTGVVTAGPPYQPNLAAAAATAVNDDADTVALVGHSGAGPLLPAIADLVGDRTLCAVFVDALLPHPGQSWFDTAPPALRTQLLGMAVDGILPPWHKWFPPGAIEELVPDPGLRREFVAEIPRLPVAYFEERAPVTSDLRRCAFLRLSAAYDRAADEAERLGWWVARRDWDHLRMLSAPEAVADLIALAISATQAE